ncbi:MULTISPECIES: aminoglycoside phosphotransferase family protein [unclassified Bacillus (in: firmicutes)]|uniref:aminoglycoside phosphotransferase family protein n=1 Tax=unclassified Bacillus (in: firmicutes) TaxID=185979 RepID=UPI0020C7CB4A|nr:MULTISPECIES: aminoglycoside phosphotransferase family protein [unclassified Bacillus (in: firmicutes)]
MIDFSFCFSQTESEKIINRFGLDFYKKVLLDLVYYADKWSLTAIQFIPSYSAKVVFKCQSKKYGDVVLKLGDPSLGEIISEYHTLCQYHARGFCRVIEADIENGVILEARIQPGTSLREENSLEKRLSVFCHFYKGLHISPSKSVVYPSYMQWVDRITEYMSKQKDCRELYLYMKKARNIYLSISAMYSEKALLHGDLHHDNILLGMDGEYIIIDPKGVIGDPVFDVPRFILNEFDNKKDRETYKKINNIIEVLEKELTIPDSIIRQCLYVETLMSVCWCIEDGGEYSSVKKDIILAEALLNSCSLNL